MGPVGTTADDAVPRSARENGATRLVPRSADGRVFRAARRVRLGDADPTGRLRLDALARYLQDIATDDSSDARDTESEAWVVRRTLLVQRAALRLDDDLALETFCTGMGSRWAERTTTLGVVGATEPSVATATLWVHLDATTGRPKGLPASFVATYGVSAARREIAARQLHDPIGPDGDDVHTLPWWPRVTDLDVLDHVNNAIAWEVVEQVLARAIERGLTTIDPAGPLHVEVEFRDAIDRAAVHASSPLVVAHRVGSTGIELALWSADASVVHLTSRLRLPD